MGLDGRAVVLPETDDRRVLYVVPWLGHALIGTTDVAFHDDPAHPRASDDEVAYLLRHVARYLDAGDLQPAVDLRRVARPRRPRGGGDAAGVARDHVVRELAPGYVTVAGGKLTTYRRIAAEAADLVARHVGTSTPSPTAEIPLRGSWRAAGGRSEVTRALTGAGVDGASVEAVLARLGAEAAVVAELCRQRSELTAPTGAGVVAEAVHAVRHECAVEVADVTLRRTELAWTTADHARAVAPAIATAMGAELGWDGAELARQLTVHEDALEQEGL